MSKQALAAAVLCGGLCASSLAGAEAAPSARRVLQKAHPGRGICLVLDDGKGELALSLARGSELTVFCQLPDAAAVRAAREAADRAGLLNRRLYVDQGDVKRLHLADNVADAAVAPGGLAEAARAEVLRVLRPGGTALLGDEELVKPSPEGAADWSHHYYGPDNNPQSADRLARAPYLTQFVAEPRYGPAPQAAVAAGGRVFLAFGHVAWHQREEPWLNTLVCLNGFNGTMLWRQELPKGLMVDRSTLIATAKTLYLADHESCKLLDAATGKLIGRIAPPAELVGGTFWKWIALEDGVLYALIGPGDAPDDEARWRRRGHGWPWGGISKGYNDPQYPWGFANTLLAIDPGTKQVLWHHKEADAPIDSRSLCMKAGRIFLAAFGKYVACLDAKAGKLLWRKTPKDDQDLFNAMGKFSPGHGYRTGWKSTVYARCTDKAVYFMGPQLEKLTAAAAEDGRLLWSLPARINVHVVIRDDGLYTIGAQNTQGETRKLNPLTGEVLATYDVWRRACTRATGSPDGIFFRAPGGTCRLDLASGKPQWISPMRPSCHIGVVIAHGHLYWVPWVCDCNLQMFGAICCAPAGAFDFGAQAAEAERLELIAAETDEEQREQEAKDKKKPRQPRRRPGASEWVTYLANNARAAQTRWSPLNVPEEAALLWEARPEAAFEPTAPVLTDGTVYLAGCDGVVRALRASSGREVWRAYTGGAVRFPPSIAHGRAFVGSADGWAYAFDAANGKLLWRFRAAPAERRICVYGRLQSTWPVASGVLVEGDAAYFAAGMTDYDGTHVFAVDARAGKLKWHNATSGHLDDFSRRGVAVQGHLLSHGGKLYLAGGNACSPGVYDMKTGKCLSPAPEGFGTRAPRGRELRLVGADVHVSGQPLYSDPDHPVYDNSARWSAPILVAGNADLLLLPGGAKEGPPWRLVAIDPFAHEELWTQPLPATPVRWGIAGDGAGRIVVTLRDGRVLCFGRGPATPPRKQPDRKPDKAKVAKAT
jgi:outer membrane protein assembly factor BamB